MKFLLLIVIYTGDVSNFKEVRVNVRDADQCRAVASIVKEELATKTYSRVEASCVPVE